jgi:hypothetical protein
VISPLLPVSVTKKNFLAFILLNIAILLFHTALSFPSKPLIFMGSLFPEKLVGSANSFPFDVRVIIFPYQYGANPYLYP